MHRLLLVLILLPSCPVSAQPAAEKAEPIRVGPTDWPWWRGPTRDGVADPAQKPPLTWSATENVRWKVEIPGRGHGSPTVVGDRVFLATADVKDGTQSMLCFNRADGKPLWTTTVHRGGVENKGNVKASPASSSPACDGRRLFINFLNAGAIHTTALSLDGKQLWQTKVADYVLHQGFGSSPAVYESLVLVSADNKGTGAIVALDRATGKEVWRRERPKLPNYASPIVLKVAGKDQLVMTGCNLVAGLEPLTGKPLWEIKGSTEECVTSTVTDGKLIFTSGGYPRNHVAAVRADGSGKVAWENGERVYVPSMLVKDEHLYGVTDAGFAFCRRCDTGKEVWKGRLGGTFSASPVLVGGVIIAVNESGRGFVFKSVPDKFDLVGENRLGDEVLASPVVCGGRIYLRVAVMSGKTRQEMLYCIGNPD